MVPLTHIKWKELRVLHVSCLANVDIYRNSFHLFSKNEGKKKQIPMSLWLYNTWNCDNEVERTTIRILQWTRIFVPILKWISIREKLNINFDSDNE